MFANIHLKDVSQNGGGEGGFPLNHCKTGTLKKRHAQKGTAVGSISSFQSWELRSAPWCDSLETPKTDELLFFAKGGSQKRHTHVPPHQNWMLKSQLPFGLRKSECLEHCRHRRTRSGSASSRNASKRFWTSCQGRAPNICSPSIITPPTNSSYH